MIDDAQGKSHENTRRLMEYDDGREVQVLVGCHGNCISLSFARSPSSLSTWKAWPWTPFISIYIFFILFSINSSSTIWENRLTKLLELAIVSSILMIVMHYLSVFLQGEMRSWSEFEGFISLANEFRPWAIFSYQAHVIHELNHSHSRRHINSCSFAYVSH